MPAAPSRRSSPAKKSEKRTTIPFIKPQLATLVDESPVGDAWISETKYDGYRMQAHVRARETILFSRNALDWSHKFQTIVDVINSTVKNRHTVLDGEIVVNTKGQASFHALQNALGEKSTVKAKYMVFDILIYDGIDLRSQPLSERRQLLAALLETFPAKSNVQISKVLRGTAAASLSKVCAVGGEGIICKKKAAPYTSGRGSHWVKVKCGKRQEFVVVGYSEPKGSREGVGALLLGVYERGKTLRYSGRVGSGFSSSELLTLRRTLTKLETKKSPLTALDDAVAVRESGKVQWVQPKLVAEISFTEWTSDGLLRHPVFQGLREDKKPTAVKREGAAN
ncbi:MAG: non-homologous end-joining DNA ligase [Gemmatimonadaceae bacterium]